MFADGLTRAKHADSPPRGRAGVLRSEAVDGYRTPPDDTVNPAILPAALPAGQRLVVFICVASAALVMDAIAAVTFALGFAALLVSVRST